MNHMLLQAAEHGVNKTLETPPPKRLTYAFLHKRKKILYVKTPSQFQILKGCRAQRSDPQLSEISEDFSIDFNRW